jgi:hypothetical protein
MRSVLRSYAWVVLGGLAMGCNAIFGIDDDYALKPPIDAARDALIVEPDARSNADSALDITPTPGDGPSDVRAQDAPRGTDIGSDGPTTVADVGTACDALGCDAMHRTCATLPTPHCDDACVSGYVWDPILMACRTPKKCADLACPADQACVEATPTQDAYCQSPQCSAGQGWDLSTKTCRPCSGGVSPTCNQIGETGHVIVTESRDGASCVCETTDGYYVAPGAPAAFPCDADGDGWVRDEAQPSIEGANLVLRLNARCHVRRVKQVVLKNEAGESLIAEDFSAQFGDPSSGIERGLPLYESARNDGAPSAGSLPDYPGRRLTPAEVNSFTKACAPDVARDDFNDNGVADVHEWSASSVTLSRSGGVSQELSDYYGKYARLSYFTELHVGWYENGIYPIVERPRIATPDRAVPIVYGPASDAGTSYSQQCKRHVDSLYRWSSVPGSVPMRLSPNTIGGDFAEFGDLQWSGMTHHSQYKCVVLVNEGDYVKYNKGQPATEEGNPEVMIVLPAQPTDASASKNAPTLARTRAGSTTPTRYDWIIDDCWASAATSSAPTPQGVANPTLSGFSCAPRASVFASGSAAWVAVTYAPPATDKTPYVDYLHSSYYKQGCIDECIDSPRFAPHVPVKPCDYCVVQAFGHGSIARTATGGECTMAAGDAGPGVKGVCFGDGLCGACVPGRTRKCSEDGKKGACATGDEVCTDAARWGECSVKPASKDVCKDGNDDNCDGTPATRNVPPCVCLQGDTQTGCGTCHGGTISCVDGQWGGCSGDSVPSNYNQPCGVCGGTIGCDGQCSNKGDNRNCDPGHCGEGCNGYCDCTTGTCSGGLCSVPDPCPGQWDCACCGVCTISSAICNKMCSNGCMP